MFEGWDNFYLMIGSAAGALIGLMFVVATLSATRDREASLRAAAVYLTPTVVGFSAVLVTSALTAVPGLHALAGGVAIGTVAAAGVLYALFTLWRMRHFTAPPHWSDWWCYGYAPVVFYVLLAVAAVGACLGAWWAADLVAGALMLLLLLAIRNAWDLVTWLAPARGDEPR